MAQAPGHRLGQIIGEALEIALFPVLDEFAREHNLYLDFHGERSARAGLKVSWEDDLGNSHDLDFVLERGGDEHRIGVPAAFIEAAWRRYTKHSKNKAQEIQGALLPLKSKFAEVQPFTGAIIGGNWTGNALDQLISSGFSVLHIDYDEVVEAFASVGIDVATEEDTSDAYLQSQVDHYERLTDRERGQLGEALRACAPEDFERFSRELQEAVLRQVKRVIVIPLHGETREYADVETAIQGLKDYSRPADVPEFVRFQIYVNFSNGDKIEASFQASEDAVEFLETFA